MPQKQHVPQIPQILTRSQIKQRTRQELDQIAARSHAVDEVLLELAERREAARRRRVLDLGRDLGLDGSPGLKG